MIDKKRLEEAKKISLIGYLKDSHGEDFFLRDDGTLSTKVNGHTMVIYDEKEPHSYTYGVVNNPYKDNIGTIRLLYGYGFEDAVNKLENWQANTANPKEDQTSPRPDINIHLFDDADKWPNVLKSYHEEVNKLPFA